MATGLLGGVETGGTKIVCAVGTSPTAITAQTRFPTGDQPAQALRQVAQFFADQTEEQGKDLLAIGIASFGPCDPDPNSPTYGYVTSTPKPGWANIDVIDGLRQELIQAGAPAGMSIVLDTDVNAAALAEVEHGAGRGLSNLVYLTVGTGIGGGVVVENQLVHGLVHPEIGHIRIPRPAAEVAVFDGVCPYHGDCWEGVASGPAIAARWGQAAQNLPPDHEAWRLEAHYLAMGLHTLVCVLSPERIIVGGGVGSHSHVLGRVRPLLQQSLAGYVASPAIVDEIDSYLVEPDLGDDAGVTGALDLAAAATEQVAHAANTPAS